MKKVSITIGIMLALIFVMSACSGRKTGQLFTTEYKIEDYCENAIIVSKSDGKVYGLLDNKGKEILPLNYDNIEFMNKNNYLDGYDDTLYLCAKYEGEYTVMNINGNEILKTPDYIHAIDLEIKNDKTDNTPFFKESVGSVYKLYNENGNLISDIPKERGYSMWISNKAYCYYNKMGNGLATYSYDGKKIDEMDACIKYIVNAIDKIYAFVLTSSSNSVNENSMKLISIDLNGNISAEKNFDSVNAGFLEYEKMRKDYKKEKYNLYSSNGTWKLEDLEGNTLYEERYFERAYPVGENDCIALTNEDNQLCIIGRNGTKYVDFGILEYKDGIFFVLDEEKIGIQEIHEGKESVIITVKSEIGYDIYYYNGK